MCKSLTRTSKELNCPAMYWKGGSGLPTAWGAANLKVLTPRAASSTAVQVTNALLADDSPPARGLYGDISTGPTVVRGSARRL